MQHTQKLLIEALEREWRLAQKNNGADSDAAVDASHGICHCRRVFRNARVIAHDLESVDLQVLTAAAFLHDIVNLPKNDPNRRFASRMSARLAEPILHKLGFADDQVEAVVHCIEAHSFSANIPTQSIEASVLQDADRLEALGAIGIARTFYIAGGMGSDLFHPEDPFAVERELDDKRFAIDHFKTKLLSLPATMNTALGRKMASERAQTLLIFLDALALELGTELPWTTAQA